MTIKFKLVDLFKQSTLHNVGGPHLIIQSAEILKSKDWRNSASGLQGRNLPSGSEETGTMEVAIYWDRNDPEGQVSGSKDQEFVFICG